MSQQKRPEQTIAFFYFVLFMIIVATAMGVSMLLMRIERESKASTVTISSPPQSPDEITRIRTSHFHKVNHADYDSGKR